MTCLKNVWKEGQNCSNSNRYISGTNWIFLIWTLMKANHIMFIYNMKRRSYDHFRKKRKKKNEKKKQKKNKKQKPQFSLRLAGIKT